MFFSVFEFSFLVFFRRYRRFFSGCLFRRLQPALSLSKGRIRRIRRFSSLVLFGGLFFRVFGGYFSFRYPSAVTVSFPAAVPVSGFL
jgi:hypothetical protein